MFSKQRKLYILFSFLLLAVILILLKSPFNLSDLWGIFFFLKEEAKTEQIYIPETKKEEIKESVSTESKIENNNQEFSQDNQEVKKGENKTSINQLNHFVPFISQAPLGKWDGLHEEACEETSLLMAYHFKQGDKLVLSKDAESDIQKISAFTKNIFPKKDDLNVDELKEVAKKYFSYDNLIIIDNPKAEDIEREIVNNSIIIAPIAGRLLDNPFFKNPGPLYHMLVITGFDKNNKIFITQDPGTKRGKDFKYSYDVILNSLHDFLDTKENILIGEKRILVIPKS